MTDRHRNRKNAIIAAAFSEWGKTHFAVMSLQPLAARLSLTKPALYRYFRNKDELLDTMVRTFTDDLGGGIRDFLARSAATALADAVRDYYGFLFDFFLSRPSYLAFLLFYVLRKIDAASSPLRTMSEPLNGYFLSLMDDRDAGRETAARFIQMHGVFWLMQVFRSDGKESAGAAGSGKRLLNFRKRIDRARAEEIRDQAVAYCLKGYCGRARLDEKTIAAVVKAAWITSADLPEPDRIFSAVGTVIGETGLSGASVERIAERIGITKSGLYFYFKNRDEMLHQTIRRERDQVGELFARRIGARAGFAEKLLAFCAAILSYMKSNPPLMSVLHWMQYQNIGPAPAGGDPAPLIAKFDFLKEALQTGELEYRGSEPALILIFIFFFLMNESRFLPDPGAPPAAFAPLLGRLFSMMCHGIGDRETAQPERNEPRRMKCQ